MQQEAVSALLRQPGYYVQSTLTNFGRLMMGVVERPRDAWATRREARNREEWEAIPEIRHLLGPPSPIQELEQRNAEAIVSLFQPARWGPVLLIGFLAGILAALTQASMRSGALPALCVIAAIGAAVALVAPLARYRWPVEPLYDLVAVGGYAWLGQTALGLVRRRRARPVEPARAAVTEGAS
jgi:hypothetical protein